MYFLENKVIREEIKPTTFSQLHMTEADMENIIQSHIEILTGEEESMLVIGKQVRNEKNGRSDLTAVDHNGNIVLIEIKRDLKDILHRKEAFEFQAIRYAASYATIKTSEEAVRLIYAPFLSKQEGADNESGLTSYERAMRKLNEFLSNNEVMNSTFNQKQRIILVASNYDELTLSAVAWLSENGVDISCFKLIPYQTETQTILNIEKVIPVETSDSFYVNLLDRTKKENKNGSKNTRVALPKIDEMLKWGVVTPGNIIKAKNRDDEAILLANGNVQVELEEMSMQSWLRRVYGWGSVQTYVFAIHKESGQSLSEIRKTYMQQQQKEDDLSL